MTKLYTIVCSYNTFYSTEERALEEIERLEKEHETLEFAVFSGEIELTEDNDEPPEVA